MIRLMIGVAKALEYLHGRRMIHGSVTLDHIVVHNGDAQVCRLRDCTCQNRHLLNRSSSGPRLRKLHRWRIRVRAVWVDRL